MTSASHPPIDLLRRIDELVDEPPTLEPTDAAAAVDVGAQDVAPAPVNTRVRTVLRDTRPPKTLQRQPARWPPRLCRWGLHWWRDIVPTAHRPAAGAPHHAPPLCSVTRRCRRCDVVRHEQNVVLPARAERRRRRSRKP